MNTSQEVPQRSASTDPALLEATIDSECKKARRSCIISIHNDMNYSLLRTKLTCVHGIWHKEPPPRIGANQCVMFAAKSNLYSGVESAVRYAVQDRNSVLHFSWVNPSVSGVDASFKAEYPPSFKVSIIETKGDHSSVKYIISEMHDVPEVPGTGSPSVSRVNTNYPMDPQQPLFPPPTNPQAQCICFLTQLSNSSATVTYANSPSRYSDLTDLVPGAPGDNIPPVPSAPSDSYPTMQSAPSGSFLANQSQTVPFSSPYPPLSVSNSYNSAVINPSITSPSYFHSSSPNFRQVISPAFTPTSISRVNSSAFNVISAQPTSTFSAQPYPAQPYTSQPYPAQPYPQQYPQQPYPAQPYPQHSYPTQPYLTQAPISQPYPSQTTMSYPSQNSTPTRTPYSPYSSMFPTQPIPFPGNSPQVTTTFPQPQPNCNNNTPYADASAHPAPSNQQKQGSSSTSQTPGSTEDNLCKVCMEKTIDCVILRCGHMCVCLGCARQLKLCCICRQPITEIIRIFKS